MIPSLLREAEAIGCVVTPEKDRLKIENAEFLTQSLRDQLKKHKNKILDNFKNQEQAKMQGWIVYPFGEAYEKCIGLHLFVYVFLEPKWYFYGM